MPPPNLPNGTPPPHPLPLSLPAHTQLPLAPSHSPQHPGSAHARTTPSYMLPNILEAGHAREPYADDSEGQSIFMSNPSQSNGAPWEPAALLDPRRAARPQTAPRRPDPTPIAQRTPSYGFGSSESSSFGGPHATTPLSGRSTTGPDTSQTSLSFSFTSPDDPTDSPGPGGSASSEAAGMGGMIERMNNVQDRAFAPPPKKRKFGEPDSGPNAKKLGGSGMLGEHIKEQSVDLTNSPARISNTVDLTDGRLNPPALDVLLHSVSLAIMG